MLSFNSAADRPEHVILMSVRYRLAEAAHLLRDVEMEASDVDILLGLIHTADLAVADWLKNWMGEMGNVVPFPTKSSSA